MNFLIIEDEILIQKSLEKVLVKKGATVDTTASGIEAVEFLKTRKYDRIICDLMLKDITGFDIIEESKAFLTPDEISHKFIIITAYSSEQILERAKSYNCRLLNKPFESLTSAIAIFMENL